ncbi:hypothetical protein ACYOEI_12935 [Singulisphaera rosea]
MRRIFVLMGVVVAAQAQSDFAPARQAEAPRPGEVNANDPRLQEILTLWEKRGVSKSLDVAYTKVVTLAPPLDFKKDRFAGRIVIDRPTNRAVFKEIKQVGDLWEPHQRILLTGGRLYRYRPDASSIVEIPHNPAELRGRANMTVLAGFTKAFTLDYNCMLQGHQLPFLFDMNVAEARRRYKEITLVRESLSTALITLTEAAGAGIGTELHAMIEVDKKTWLPKRVVWYGPGQATCVFSFTQIKRDGPVREEDLAVIPIERWKSK